MEEKGAGLSTRQREILVRTIESYITNVFPVGSRALIERCGFLLSPATVRHEMGILEELGYLAHPHTSAGRVPTDKGYEFYVKEAVSEERVPEEILLEISQEFEGKIRNLENLLERASRILSRIVEEAVLIVSPTWHELYMKELRLVPLGGTRLLAVWCTTSGLVQDCLVEMEEAISAEGMQQILRLVNEDLFGCPLESLESELLRKIQVQKDSLQRVYRQTLEIVRESLPLCSRPKVFVEGSRYVLNQPEFQDPEKFHPLVSMLEEKSYLVRLLTADTPSQGIRVAIGERDLTKKMWDCSLVSASYSCEGKAVGTIGVLGPRRMAYGRIMGLVRQTTGLISGALGRLGA